MRILLDTQIAIWALTDTKRLSERARTLIGDEANDVFVSAVSVGRSRSNSRWQSGLAPLRFPAQSRATHFAQRDTGC